MRLAIGVGRPVMQHEFLAALRGLAQLFVKPHRLPTRQDHRLAVRQIPAHREIGFGQKDGRTVIRWHREPLDERRQKTTTSRSSVEDRADNAPYRSAARRHRPDITAALAEFERLLAAPAVSSAPQRHLKDGVAGAVMLIYALIPARSGSKGLPDKNILPIDGHPLIAYSIAFAQKLEIDRELVSTDSPVYREISLRYGGEWPYLCGPPSSAHPALASP